MIFDKLGQMGDLLKKAGELKGTLKNIQEELSHTTYEAESAGVKVAISGDMELKQLTIPQDLLKAGDARRLEYLVSDAFSKALRDAKGAAAGKFKQLTGGLSIPGLF